MGLFDFALDMGKKLFGKEDDPAEKITEAIEEAGLGIDNLNVGFADGKVAISGNAPSVEAMEKAVLIAGNVQGVSEVSADGVETPPQPQEPKVEYYVIVSGDTLSGIAKRFLGNAMDYPKIFEANREVIKDPDLIYPGQKIRIPLD